MVSKNPSSRFILSLYPLKAIITDALHRVSEYHSTASSPIRYHVYKGSIIFLPGFEARSMMIVKVTICKQIFVRELTMQTIRSVLIHDPPLWDHLTWLTSFISISGLIHDPPLWDHLTWVTSFISISGLITIRNGR